MLIRVLRTIARPLRPLFLLILRTIPVEDPWERMDFQFPHEFLGPASRHDFNWYFEGDSSVRVRNLRELRAWLRKCRYVSDEEMFREPDFWQHPLTFERLRKGDCEDFAFWAWRKLVELGCDADFIIGRCQPSQAPDSGHAWIVLRQDGTEYLVEPTRAAGDDWMRPLSEVKEQYVPHFGVSRDRQRFTFAGYLLTLRTKR
jgi:hypothetical protein